MFDPFRVFTIGFHLFSQPGFAWGVQGSAGGREGLAGRARAVAPLECALVCFRGLLEDASVSIIVWAVILS